MNPSAATASSQEMPWWRNWKFWGLMAAGIVAIYGLIAGDLWLRARQAYQEGEKYLRWHYQPQEKEKYLGKKLSQEKTELKRLLDKKRISESEYKERVELAEFDHQQALSDSSAKYAYIWYQTAVELFSPPESVWVKRAKEKMPQAKALWIKELHAKKIPFENYMLE